MYVASRRRSEAASSSKATLRLRRSRNPTDSVFFSTGLIESGIREFGENPHPCQVVLSPRVRNPQNNVALAIGVNTRGVRGCKFLTDRLPRKRYDTVGHLSTAFDPASGTDLSAAELIGRTDPDDSPPHRPLNRVRQAPQGQHPAYFVGVALFV